MRLRYPDKAVKGWFVTREEPTAEQRSVATKHAGVIRVTSFDQFRSQLIDARTYLDCRQLYPFGSMQDPEAKADIKSGFEYIKLDMLTSSGEKWGVTDITSELLVGHRFVLLGDYGAGKSTTMRELYLALAGNFKKTRSIIFPVMLNLRDHHGQTNPAEALARHARYIGYSTPSHLVRAWRAGYVVLLLDGFDEIATVGWLGQAKKLIDIRFRSMELLRNFINEAPPGSGIVISGRQHFFDNKKELNTALALKNNFTQLSLNDFTDEQVREYLSKKGWTEAIPSWLPSRPLLLGYLASQDLLEQVLKVDKGSTPAAGWNALLTRVCDREARIEAGIDGETVRQLVERLATIARCNSDGLGPLQPDTIRQAFQQVCGYAPDDRGFVLLQRLPGLGANKQEDGSRDFIDQDFVDAARAGDVVRFIENPYTFDIESPSEWQSTLGQLGRELSAYLCSQRKFKSAKLSASTEVAGKKDGFNTLSADIIEVMKEMGYRYDGNALFIKGVLLQYSPLGDEGENYSKITYQNCLFERLSIAAQANPDLLPKFLDCYFGVVEGRVSAKDLPQSVFDKDCVFESFDDSAETSAAILDLSLPLNVRVLLTVLRKLYLQPGRGRKEGAFFRGLDYRARSLVPEVLQLIRREQLASRSSVGEEAVWLPVRSEGQRIQRLLAAPTASNDPLIASLGTID